MLFWILNVCNTLFYIILLRNFVIYSTVIGKSVLLKTKYIYVNKINMST